MMTRPIPVARWLASVCLMTFSISLIQPALRADQANEAPVSSDDAGADAAQTALIKALAGKWRIIRISSDGLTKEADEIEMREVVFREKEPVFKLGGGEFSFLMRYRADLSKTPHPVRIVIEQSPFGPDETPHPGLIELKDDSLKLIYAIDGEAAPKDFSAPGGKRWRSLVLKRVKE